MSNAGSVSIVLSANATSFSKALDDAQRNLDKLGNKAKQASGHTVSGMQAASASIRLLENPLGNNIRAIERLISQSKILSGVLKAAFPLVGAVAISSMLIKLGTEVAEFITKVNQMPTAIRNGFNELNLAGKTATDELTVTNDKLAEAIAKLEHKPVNNAKTAMDELTVAADKAAEHIVSTNAKLNDLLSKNHLSGLSVLLGKVGTGDRENAAKRFGQQSDDAAYDLANASTPAQVAAAQAKLKKVQDDQLAEARSDLARRQAVAAGPDASHTDDSANMNIDKGVITSILNQRKQQQAELTNADLSATKDRLDAQKTAAQQAKEAANKAAQDRLKSFQDAFDQEKQSHQLDLVDTYNYWQSKLSAFTKGSSEYQSILAKETAAAVEGAAKAHEAITKQQREDAADTNSTEGTDILNRANEFFGRMNSQKTSDINAGYIDSNQLAMVQAKNAAEEQSARISDDAGRSITKVAAATQLAAVHTQEYVTQLRALQSIADIRNAAAKAAPDDKEAARAAEQANAALDTAQKNRQLQIQSDSDNISGRTTSGAVGFQDALNDFVLASQDAAAQMHQLADSTLSSLNSEIVKGLSGQRTSFRNMGAGVFRNVAGAGLNKAEGSILGTFGFGGGKPDGSASKPLYVRMADGVSGVANSAGNFMSKLFSGSSPASSATTGSGTSGASGVLNGMGSLFMSALPMLASGGPLAANTMAIVGEKGPELFMPSSSGTVIPNHSLTNLGGGDTHHTWNIDARGSNDPAAVKAMVTQGIMEAAPHIMSATLKAGSEQRKRSAPSAQR